MGASPSTNGVARSGSLFVSSKHSGCTNEVFLCQAPRGERYESACCIAVCNLFRPSAKSAPR
jgi:hypothetical protein